MLHNLNKYWKESPPASTTIVLKRLSQLSILLATIKYSEKFITLHNLKVCWIESPTIATIVFFQLSILLEMIKYSEKFITLHNLYECWKESPASTTIALKKLLSVGNFVEKEPCQGEYLVPDRKLLTIEFIKYNDIFQNE